MKTPEPFDFSPALTLLLACCQEEPDDEKIAQYCLNIDDWNAFIDLAYEHGVLPLVHHALKNQLCLPDNVINELKYEYLAIAKQNMLMSAELVKIVKVFEGHGIEAMPFKGPVLAQLAYGDITLRQYLDLDILVHRQQAYNAGALLADNHYTSADSLILFKNKAMLDIYSDLSLTNTRNNIKTEVHWQLFWQFHQIRFDENDIWKYSSVCKIHNNQIKTFSPEFLLSYLCAHGSKHQWMRIEWLVDIARLIHSCSDIDWNVTMKIAKRSHTMTQLLLGLSLVNALFSTKMPQNIADQFKNKKIVFLQKRTFIFLRDSIEKRSFFYHLKLQDSLLDKVVYTWQILFKPKLFDIKSIDLPDNFSLLYYLVELKRVLFKVPRYLLRRLREIINLELNK